MPIIGSIALVANSCSKSNQIIIICIDTTIFELFRGAVVHLDDDFAPQLPVGWFLHLTMWNSFMARKILATKVQCELHAPRRIAADWIHAIPG
jgi:hypothetical protein